MQSLLEPTHVLQVNVYAGTVMTSFKSNNMIIQHRITDSKQIH